MLIPMDYQGTVIRPPSEQNSMLVQYTVGCSYNGCFFCPAYKTKDSKYNIRNIAEITRQLDRLDVNAFRNAYSNNKDGKGRIFILSGDPLSAPEDGLMNLFLYLNQRFHPNIDRIATYGSARSLKTKSDEFLRTLNKLGLKLIYFGLESGDEATLKLANKGATIDEMIKQSRRATDSGIDVSVMVLMGLGGTELSAQHARNTAETLNKMQPIKYLSPLTLRIVPPSTYYNWQQRGKFNPITDVGSLQELKILLKHLELKDECYFSFMHASNVLSLTGKLPHDKERLMEEVNQGLRGQKKLREWEGGL